MALRVKDLDWTIWFLIGFVIAAAFALVSDFLIFKVLAFIAGLAFGFEAVAQQLDRR